MRQSRDKRHRDRWRIGARSPRALKRLKTRHQRLALHDVDVPTVEYWQIRNERASSERTMRLVPAAARGAAIPALILDANSRPGFKRAERSGNIVIPLKKFVD